MTTIEKPSSPDAGTSPMMPQHQAEYLQAMIAGSGRQADKTVENALQSGLTVNDVYLGIFQPTAYEVGRLWQVNKFTVAQEHLATAIIERQMGDLHSLFKPIRELPNAVVIACVDKEFHRVGARMVADFLEQAGWNVYYLGAAVPTDTFIAILKETGANLAAVSVQMLYHVPTVRSITQALAHNGLDGIPFMAGGLPFVQQPELHRTLGVRFSGPDALSAVRVAESLVTS